MKAQTIANWFLKGDFRVAMASKKGMEIREPGLLGTDKEEVSPEAMTCAAVFASTVIIQYFMEDDSLEDDIFRHL